MEAALDTALPFQTPPKAVASDLTIGLDSSTKLLASCNDFINWVLNEYLEETRDCSFKYLPLEKYWIVTARMA